MERLFILAGLIVIVVSIVILGVAISNLFFMRKHPEYSLFPVVTTCRLCSKKIYVWQRRESRWYKTNLDNPDNIAITAKAGGLVHKKCKGTPEFNLEVSFAHSNDGKG